MTPREHAGEYVARASGSVGCEILADGEVIAWTVDGWWVAITPALLNRVQTERDHL
jgi:hypothetical protein